MLNLNDFFAKNNGSVTIRQLAVAHAGGKRPGGKNYRLVRKLIDQNVIFQIGDNLFIKGF